MWPIFDCYSDMPLFEYRIRDVILECSFSTVTQEHTASNKNGGKNQKNEESQPHSACKSFSDILEKFQTVTIRSLETLFVTRIEKINAVYTNFKETKLEEDIKSLAKEKLKLERENQILSKQKSTISNQMNESNPDMTYKPCKSCKYYEEKCKSYEEKCKSYEEKIRSKENLHSEMVLDYEIEKSKLQNSAKF